MSRYQVTSRSIWNFFICPRLFFKKYQNCNLSFLKKHTSANEFQIEGEKLWLTLQNIYMKTFTCQNYRVLEPVYSGHHWEPRNPCFCAVYSKTCIAHSQSDSIIFFFWYIISIEKVNTNRTCVLNILLNYDFAFNIGQSNLIYCDIIVTKLGTSCAFFVEWLISKISQVISAFEFNNYVLYIKMYQKWFSHSCSCTTVK